MFFVKYENASAGVVFKSVVSFYDDRNRWKGGKLIFRKGFTNESNIYVFLSDDGL